MKIEMPTVKEMRREKKRQEKLEQERLEKERRDRELEEEEEAKRSKLNNDIKDIRSVKMLDKVFLDFDSPRLRQAMDDLGVKQEECMKK